jgi:hypothetical protein
MLDPSAAENQLSTISTFHPVSRIQGTTFILQPVINGVNLDQISMKPRICHLLLFSQGLLYGLFITGRNGTSRQIPNMDILQFSAAS